MRQLPILLLSVIAAAQSNLPAPPVGAHAGYKVVDLETGLTLAAYHDDESFTPASNVKLYTAAFALEHLGPDFRFLTELRTSAAAIAPTLPDLRLVGGGDPNLSGRVIPYVVDAPDGDPLAALRDLVRALQTAGVTAIDGDVVGVSSRYPLPLIPAAWAWDDTLYGYGAPVSALTFNDNTVTLLLSPSTLGELAALRLRPAVSDLVVVNQVVTASPGKTELHIERPFHSAELIVRGTIGLEAGEIPADVAMSDPALAAAKALTDLLRDNGIAVRGEPRSQYEDPGPPGTLIASHLSAPLSQIVQAMNKPSQNLHAELLLREASLSGDRAQFLTSIQAPLTADDGSGLAESDLASPAATVNLLQHMWTGPNRDIWLTSLPIGGVDGTLQHRFAGIPNAARVHAKTGSLSHANSLSGYLETARHTWLAFSIFVDDTAIPGRDVRAYIDNFCAVFLQQ